MHQLNNVFRLDIFGRVKYYHFDALDRKFAAHTRTRGDDFVLKINEKIYFEVCAKFPHLFLLVVRTLSQRKVFIDR